MAARVVAARASVAAARSVARAPALSAVPVRAFASAGDFSSVAGRAFGLRDKKRLNAYVEQAKEFEKFENLLASAGGAENPQQLAALIKKNADLGASVRKLVDLENAQIPADSQLDPYQREFNKLKAQLRDVDGIDTPTGFINYVNSHPEIQATVERLRTITDAATQGASAALPSTKAPVRVTVTGASGAIGYSLLFRIASGQMLGPDQPVILQLLELPGAMQTLQGVAMELDDCAFPLLKGIVQTSDAQVGFEGADYALLVGAKPRGKGMERGDLLKDNANIFKAQGQALNSVANKSVKVGVVGNPANTNAMITSYFAPTIAPRQITAMTRLDHTRGLAQLAAKLGCDTVDIEKFCIWGNHSATQYPDVSHAQVVRGPKAGAIKAAVNEEWLAKTFIPAVQTRGAAIIAARGASSAASAANAAVEHMRDWALGTNGKWTSMAVCSEGEYGVDKGLWYSYPVVCAGGDYSIVGNVPCDKFSKERMDATRKELLDEKKAVSALLK